MSPGLLYAFRFLLLVALQATLLRSIPLQWWSQPSGFPVFVPLLYPLFLLLLPFSMRPAAQMVWGFLLGAAVDLFYNTGGMHAAACVVLAFARTPVLSALLPRHLGEYGPQVPLPRTMGWVPFFTYAALMVLVHHTVFFLLEIWSLRLPGYLLTKILASGVTTLLLVVAYVLLFGRQRAEPAR